MSNTNSLFGCIYYEIGKLRLFLGGQASAARPGCWVPLLRAMEPDLATNGSHRVTEHRRILGGGEQYKARAWAKTTRRRSSSATPGESEASATEVDGGGRGGGRQV